MPIQNLTSTASVNWTLSKTNTGYQNTTEGPDALNFSLATLNTSTWTQLVSLNYTIAASGTQTINLQSLTNLIGESVNFTHVLTLMVSPAGSSVQVQPAVSNGFSWFMNSTAVLTIPNGGCLYYSDAATGSGGTVDGTHNSITFTNNGATTLTLSVVILGKTT